jgi:hypothetical protein
VSVANGRRGSGVGVEQKGPVERMDDSPKAALPNAARIDENNKIRFFHLLSEANYDGASSLLQFPSPGRRYRTSSAWEATYEGRETADLDLREEEERKENGKR